MRQRTIILYFKLTLFFILLVSCNKPKKDSIKFKTCSSYKDKTVQFNFYFPDTVIVNKLYDGNISYKGILDTITTNFDDQIEKQGKNRYIIFSYIKTKEVNYDGKYLSKITTDTIGADDCHNIHLYDFKFTEIGVYYIDGIINDNAIITLNEDENQGRSITNEIRATHKVVVIENK